MRANSTSGTPAPCALAEKASVALRGNPQYLLEMETAAKLLEEAMRLPEDEREDLAAKLLDSLEPPTGISVDDRDEIEKRAKDARSGAPGVTWDELQRDLLK